MERQPYILAELEDLSQIYAPLKSTSRIKYTSFNVSHNFLVFGATSGGLYLFRREPCIFLQLLPNKEGAVTQVAISPDEKLLAFATVKGLICVLERSSSHGAKHIVTSFEHQGSQVTCLQWNSENNELYAGDDCGKVSIITVSLFPPTKMFQTPTFLLMQLDSKIVQMDLNSDMLLVSTLSKCYICDTSKELFRQIGHKLRDGEYGACIYNTQDGENTSKNVSRTRDRVGFALDTEKNQLDYPDLKHLKLLCARPGSRIWEVAIDGTVISTHHFKEALAISPRKIIFQDNLSSQSSDVNYLNNINNLANSSCLGNERNNSNYGEQSFNFQKLYKLLSKFVFTFKCDGIYIFDPEKADVVLWNDEITEIVDVRCINDVIYVWSGFRKMYALNLVPLEKFLIRLYFRKKYITLAKLCLEYGEYLKTQANGSSKLYLLHDLDEKLKESQGYADATVLSDRLKPLFEILHKNAQHRQVQNAQKLKSGIFLIGNNAHLPGIVDKTLEKDKILRPSYLNLKGRSHSVSPDRLQKDVTKNQGSASSLPDLVKEGKMEEEPDYTPRDKRPFINVEKVIEVDTESTLNVCEELKNSHEPSKELIFRLFDNILALAIPETTAIKSRNTILESVNSLPFYSYFSDENIQLISETFHSALKSQLLFDWLNQFSASQLNGYPNFILNNYANSSLQLDFKLSRVLKLFSSILDENRIVDLIKDTKMECYFLSLLEIIDVFQDSSLSSVSESTLNLSNISSITRTLNVVYFLIKVGQIDKCSKYSSKIDVTDILYLMFKFQRHLSQSGRSEEIIELQCQTLFLSYLDKASNRNQLILDAGNIVQDYIISCLEKVNSSASSVKESNCDCGFPYPGLRPSISMFTEIGYALVEKTWPLTPIQCISMCGKIPYLWKYLLDFRKDEPLITILPLIVQLGELSELENRLTELDDKILEISLRHLIGLKNGNCLNCGKKMKSTVGTISWTDFGMLCVKSIGPQTTLNMFLKYSSDISSYELDKSFYQALIFSSIMEKHSKGLRKNVVDLLVGKTEEDINRRPVFSDEVKRDVMAEESFEKATSIDHHWGIKLKVKNCCASCSLSLDSEVLVSEGGLIIFKCSHAFHSVCLKKADSECPVCNKGE